VPPRWQRSLDDYIDIAAYLLGGDRAAIAALPRIALAESALHAPFASFGGIDAYPTLVEQAAVLLQHLAKNHPLPDANKRAAFLLTARFLDANGRQWGVPDVDADAGLVERVAAGEASHEEVMAWISKRIREKGDERPPSPQPRGKARKLRSSTLRRALARTACFPGISRLRTAPTHD
jgi:death on curing protein